MKWDWVISGRGDLVLDGNARVMRFKGGEIAYGQIERLAVRREEANDLIAYSVWVKEAGGEPQLRLKKWIGEAGAESARRTAAYLSLMLGVPALDETGKEIGVVSTAD